MIAQVLHKGKSLEMKNFRFTMCLFTMVCALSVGATASGAPGPEHEHFNVRSFGAVGDGKKLDSPAIDSAIAACANSGGGTVFVPAGTYLCGSIHLKSHVHLYLD